MKTLTSKIPDDLFAEIARMIEKTRNGVVFTTDSDFPIYRQKSRPMIPLLFPG